MIGRIGKNKGKVTATIGAVLALALPFTAHEEGLRTFAYLDPVGVVTICMGETENVTLGDTKTKEECSALFYARLGSFAYAVDLAVKPPMDNYFHAAITSWTYNVGVNAMRRSTLVKKANAGDFRGACDELLKWKFAGGEPILLSRRRRERELCLTMVGNDA